MVPLHVVPLSYFYEADLTTPESLLDRYATIRPLAKALHGEGVSVTVVQRFHTDLDGWDGGVRFRFCADSCQPGLRKWEMPRSFHSCVRDVCASSYVPGAVQTAVHLNGLLYPLQLRALRASLSPDCSIVVQDHANRPWRASVRRLQRWGLRAADGFFFAARDLAASWMDDGLISKHQSIFEIMEGSNNFQCRDRSTSRARTGMTGSPVVLWVGRLTFDDRRKRQIFFHMRRIGRENGGRLRVEVVQKFLDHARDIRTFEKLIGVGKKFSFEIDIAF